MLRNLILDYNGVISNDFELVYKTAMKLYEKYGLELVSFSQFKDSFKIPATVFWSELLPQIDFDELNANYFEIYQSFGSPQLYPGAKETLRHLADKGVVMIILSSHHEKNLLNELNNFGIDRSIFSNIYCDVKNKLDVIENILDENDFLSKETAYVGDTEHDIETGKKAKLVTVASTYGYRTKQQLEKEKPDYFIDSVDKILDIVVQKSGK